MKTRYRPVAAPWASALLLATSLLASAKPLPFNTTITGSLSQPGQQASYTFTGTAGQRFFYDSLEADFDNIAVRLFNPANNIVFLNQNSDSDGGPYVFTETGTYTLLIDGNAATIGDYIFRLDDLNNQPALPLNTAINKTLTPGYAVDWFQYNASGGEHLYFDGQGGNNGANWYFFGPANENLGSANITGDFEVVLNQPGTYLLAVAGNSANPVPYSVQVTTAKTTTTKIQLDTIVTGSIANPGDKAVYTFTANAGQRIFYDSMEGNFDPISVSLLNPAGAVVLLNQNSDSDGGPYTLTDTGTYSIVIDGNGATTGSYSFRVENLSARPVFPFDTPVQKTLNPGYSVDWYSIDGTAGQTLYFDGLGSNAGGSWYLFGPGNENLGSAGIGGDFEITLPRDGSYLVAVAGSSPNPVPYSVQIVTFETPVTPLVIGATVSGTISEPGERDSYTFTGTVGQRLYFNSLDRDFESINVRLLSPVGNNVSLWEINHSQNQGPFTLTQAGTYTLVVDGNGSTVGDYSFRILDLSTATPMNLTSTLAGSLSPRSKTEAYQFNGTKGQRISFDSISATSSEASWRLVTPANITVSAGNITTDIASAVLPESGPMLLLFEGTVENNSPLNFQVRLSDISDVPVATVGLGQILSGTVSAANPVTSTFNASAGTLIYFDSQDRTASGVTVEFKDPTNAQFQNIGAASDAGPFLLGKTGTYSVIVHGNGNYRFRIIDLSTAPNLVFGSEIQASLDPAFRTDVYQFTATPGKRLLYDGVDNDNDNIPSRLLAPDGSFRFNINSDSDTAPFTLQVPGVYYLFVESNLASVADYHFRLWDVDASPLVAPGSPMDGTLNPGTTATLYRFAGDAGRLLYFDATGSNTGGNWALYDPSNNQVVGANISNDMEIVLPQSGTYVLALFGNNPNSVPYAFQMYDPNAVVGGPIITAVNLVGGNANIVWTAIAGKTYTLQFKADLDALTWVDVPGNIVAGGPSASKNDPLGANLKRYYRVLQLP